MKCQRHNFKGMSNNNGNGTISSVTSVNPAVCTRLNSSHSNNEANGSNTQNTTSKQDDKHPKNTSAPDAIETNTNIAGTSSRGIRTINCNLVLINNDTRIDLNEEIPAQITAPQTCPENLNTNNETLNSQQTRDDNPRTPTRNFQSSNPNPQRSNLLKSYRCYRAFCGQTNSDIEITTSPPLATSAVNMPPPIAGAPPSYSAVMHFSTAEEPWTVQGRRPVCVQPSPAFIAPIPPPSYAEVQGFQIERPMLVTSVEQLVWGPEPLTIVCPRCSHIVITATESQRSNITHFLALALCLCGCWPCCLLPYCMDSCRNTYHRCPICNQFLGMYRPW